ncbi:MAG: thioredoxin family protein [Chthonomonadales bacterium]
MATQCLGSRVIAGMAVLVLGASLAPRAQGDDTASKLHGPIPWKTSLSEAAKVAAKQRKIMLVDFYAEWCGPCQAMLKTTYRDKAVVKQMGRFVPVLIDVDKEGKLAQKYGVEAVPTTLFLTPDGKVLRSETGYHNAEDFLRLTKEVLAKAPKPAAGNQRKKHSAHRDGLTAEHAVG